MDHGPWGFGPVSDSGVEWSGVATAAREGAGPQVTSIRTIPSQNRFRWPSAKSRQKQRGNKANKLAYLEV